MRIPYRRVRAVFLALVGMGLLQHPVAAAATVRIETLNWLAGIWFGRNGADDVAESYLPAQGGEILGLFKAVRNGQVTRTEVRSIREENGAIIFQERAFNPGLQPAKPVPTRTLISADATHIIFNGASIVRTGENSMTVTVILPQPAGPSRIVKMFYTRASKTVTP